MGLNILLIFVTLVGIALCGPLIVTFKTKERFKNHSVKLITKAFNVDGSRLHMETLKIQENFSDYNITIDGFTVRKSTFDQNVNISMGFNDTKIKTELENKKGAVATLSGEFNFTKILGTEEIREKGLYELSTNYISYSVVAGEKEELMFEFKPHFLLLIEPLDANDQKILKKIFSEVEEEETYQPQGIIAVNHHLGKYYKAVLKSIPIVTSNNTGLELQLSTQNDTIIDKFGIVEHYSAILTQDNKEIEEDNSDVKPPREFPYNQTKTSQIFISKRLPSNLFSFINRGYRQQYNENNTSIFGFNFTAEYLNNFFPDILNKYQKNDKFHMNYRTHSYKNLLYKGQLNFVLGFTSHRTKRQMVYIQIDMDVGFKVIPSGTEINFAVNPNPNSFNITKVIVGGYAGRVFKPELTAELNKIIPNYLNAMKPFLKNRIDFSSELSSIADPIETEEGFILQEKNTTEKNFISMLE